jgi:glycine hydroxymethyltransferase
VYFALLEPGATVLGMNPSHGGHLTHGSPVNFSGRFFRIVPYGVREDTGRIDYDSLGDLARTHRPAMIVAGASAYARTIDFPAFAEVAREVGAKLMVDMAHIAGLVATGVHPSPVPYADAVTTTTHKTLRGPRGGLILCRGEHAEAMDPSFIKYTRRIVANARALAESLMERGFKLVSDGTDNHLMLVDLRNRGITGKDAERALGLAEITVNKNTVPGETQSPFVTSGMRIGTAAVTTRGMGEAEMRTVAGFIDEVLRAPDDAGTAERVRHRVRELAGAFPLYRAAAAMPSR